MKQTEQLEFEFLKALDCTTKVRAVQKNDTHSQLRICRKCLQRIDLVGQCCDRKTIKKPA